MTRPLLPGVDDRDLIAWRGYDEYRRGWLDRAFRERWFAPYRRRWPCPSVVDVDEVAATRTTSTRASAASCPTSWERVAATATPTSPASRRRPRPRHVRPGRPGQVRGRRGARVSPRRARMRAARPRRAPRPNGAIPPEPVPPSTGRRRRWGGERRVVTGEWLTCADVADDLGVSISTVVRWVKAGDLPALRLPGGHLRISRAGYVDWQAARMLEGNASSTDSVPNHASGPAPRNGAGPTPRSSSMQQGSVSRNRGGWRGYWREGGRGRWTGPSARRARRAAS